MVLGPYYLKTRKTYTNSLKISEICIYVKNGENMHLRVFKQTLF
jgi:hypothetical protein